MALVFTDRFRRQFNATAETLERERRGAGVGLRLLVFRSLELVEAFPEMHAEYEPDVRRILIKKYHQHIYYTLVDRNVILIGMLDARSRPRDEEE